MARRILELENVRNLTKMGHGRSLGITLPIKFVRELGWRARQQVVVSRRGRFLIIQAVSDRI